MSLRVSSVEGFRFRRAGSPFWLHAPKFCVTRHEISGPPGVELRAEVRFGGFPFPIHSTVGLPVLLRRSTKPNFYPADNIR